MSDELPLSLRGLGSAGPERALLLHSDPDEVMRLLETAGGLDWAVAARPRDVTGALARHAPSIVFSMKHSGFPGAAHRPAIEAPSVRWFHVGGSGTDHLSGYDTARVTLTDCAGVLAPFLAERALSALLSLSTGLASFGEAQRARLWRPSRFSSLAGKTALIVGAGFAGSAFARLLRPFGVKLVGLRRSPRPAPEFDEVHGAEALDALLPLADVVSIHVPLNAGTHRLFDARRIGSLRAGAYLLNSSRGAVVDEAALLDRLASEEASGSAGRLGGVWLDVFEEEPLPATSRLWDAPRLLITPHCADQVEDYPVLFARRFLDVWSTHRRAIAGE